MIPRSSDPELGHPPLLALPTTESLSNASGRSGGAVNPRIISAFGALPHCCPALRRRSDKGLPQYRDNVESDIFVLSGAEDLVPALVCDGKGQPGFDEFERDGYRVKRYRPRIEGLSARLERWTCIATGAAHWRSLSKDNVLTVYGLDGTSRIADPENPEHGAG
jgi:Salmonella virulence plasmid 65kDa B protein